MSRQIVFIVWVIHEFRQANYRFTRILSSKIVRIIIAFIAINFEFSKRLTRIKLINASNLLYSLEWIINNFVFWVVCQQFYDDVQLYRQSQIYQNFVFKFIIILLFVVNFTLSKFSTTSNRRSTTIDVANLRQIEKNFFITRKQSQIQLSTRISSYSFIINSKIDINFINSKIDNNFVETNHSNFVNYLNFANHTKTTREISIKKIIYDQFLKSNLIIIIITMNVNLNSIVQTIITIVVSIVVTQVLQQFQQQLTQMQNQSNSIESLNSSKSIDENDNNNDDNNNFQFQSKYIKFFDSHYNKKIVIIEALMKHINESIVFRDVHVFVIKVKTFVVTKNEKMIRRNFFLFKKRCFELIYFFAH